MGDLSPRLDPLPKLQGSTALSKRLLQPNTWRRRFVCFSIVTGSRLTHVRPWPKLCEATLGMAIWRNSAQRCHLSRRIEFCSCSERWYCAPKIRKYIFRCEAVDKYMTSSDQKWTAWDTGVFFQCLSQAHKTAFLTSTCTFGAPRCVLCVYFPPVSSDLPLVFRLKWFAWRVIMATRTQLSTWTPTYFGTTWDFLKMNTW